MNKTPILTEDIVSYIEKITDVQPKPSDSDSELRWKAAQRNVGITVRGLFETQKRSAAGNAKDTAATLGIQLRPEDFDDAS